MDTDYGTNGFARIPMGWSSSARATGVMLQDGSIISIGTFDAGNGTDYWLALAKFDANGDPDPGFGDGGLAAGPVVVNTTDGIALIGTSVLPDGRILLRRHQRS